MEILNLWESPNSYGTRGLLARTIHDGPHGDYSVYYFGDAMGNVRALMGDSGTVVAHYLYDDPFGNLLAASGRLSPIPMPNIKASDWKNTHPRPLR